MAAIRVADAETALAAAEAGLGRTLLPDLAVRCVAGLARGPCYEASLSRDVWLLSHAAQKDRPSIRVAAAWLVSAMRPV